MRENVLLRVGLALLITLPISFLLLNPPLLRCLWVGWSASYRMSAGTQNLYVHQTATARQKHQLRRHVLTAQDRIRRFWGNRRGRATLIYCPSQMDYEQYCDGGEGAGCSLGMPWGSTYLILGPDGNNTDVIAHELCHDELFARLGWWRVKRQIPQWFNEGLALMVDYRFSNPAVWERPDSTGKNDSDAREKTEKTFIPFPMRTTIQLTDLETTRDFFGGDYAHTMMAYQTAASEVTHWLSIVGRAGVPALTDAVADGTDFAVAYRTLEKQQSEPSR